MINWFDIAAYAFLTILSLFLIFETFRFRQKYKKAVLSVAQVHLDKAALQKQLERVVQEMQIQESDGFIKFLSDSREWAFKYIEDVQSSVDEILKEVNPLIEQYKKASLSQDEKNVLLNKLVVSYNKLALLMPNDSPEINKD